MSNPNIIKGYKGIMDLDLSTIPPSFHKETVAQHIKDIQEYKMEQLSRPARLRYENTVVPAFKTQEKMLLAQRRVAKEAQDEKERIYQNRLKPMNISYKL
tara:strand:+ start:238 stop:537 length:300 start_codon:yes stop_codon:yes gene_type:complete